MATAQVGTVLRRQPIGPSQGGFTGTVLAADAFGASLAPLGDLDGDGIADLAVGAPGDNDGGPARGAIWILFLNANGTVSSQTKISQTRGGFTGVLTDNGFFAMRMDNVGDLDGDGVPELAVYSSRLSRFWVLFLRPDGTVKNQTENRFTDPVFVPPTLPRHFNGQKGPGGLEALGDLDGDGLGDLAIGAPYDPDGAGLRTGAIWIVRLKADGTMKAAHKISQTQGGFAGVLHEEDHFGYTIAQLGDLDGDGNRELAVMASGGTFATWILYLDANERVMNQRPIHVGENHAWLGDLDGDGNGEILTDSLRVAFLKPDDSVGKILGSRPSLDRRFEPLGDLDGDGNPEVAAGIGFVGGNGLAIVTLDPSAVRNGSGVNPLILSQASEPVIGSTWSATLDCTGHASGQAVVFGFSAPTSGLFSPFGEHLVTGRLVFDLSAPHASGPTLLVGNVPNKVQLINQPVYVQGLCTGAPGTRLSNALDLLVGR